MLIKDIRPGDIYIDLDNYEDVGVDASVLILTVEHQKTHVNQCNIFVLYSGGRIDEWIVEAERTIEFYRLKLVNKEKEIK